MSSFPLYLLRFGKKWKVIFPEDRDDVGHTDFWERTVSYLVAQHYGIPVAKLGNLPYCQRRARVVGNRVYYGGKPDPELLEVIRREVGNNKLTFCHDDHEKRLKEDVLKFRRLVRLFSISGQNPQ
jgi:hypothetical protein